MRRQRGRCAERSVADRPQGHLNVESGETVKCVFTNTQNSPPGGSPPTHPNTGVAGGGAQQTIKGTASLGAPSGCAGLRFRARVKGKGIAKVVFYLDGKKVKTIRKSGGGSVLIDTRPLRIGAHRLMAKVTFVASSTIKRKTLKRTFQRCKFVGPRFTG